MCLKCAKYRHLSQLWSKVIQIYGHLLENRLPKINGTVEPQLYYTLNTTTRCKIATGWKLAYCIHIWTYEQHEHGIRHPGTTQSKTMKENCWHAVLIITSHICHSFCVTTAVHAIALHAVVRSISTVHLKGKDCSFMSNPPYIGKILQK